MYHIKEFIMYTYIVYVYKQPFWTQQWKKGPCRPESHTWAQADQNAEAQYMETRSKKAFAPLNIKKKKKKKKKKNKCQ